MKQFNYTMKLKMGFHARPCALLADRVRSLDSKVNVIYGEKEADATQMLPLLSLKVRCGETVLVTVEGENEEEDMEILKKVFEENF